MNIYKIVPITHTEKDDVEGDHFHEYHIWADSFCESDGVTEFHKNTEGVIATVPTLHCVIIKTKTTNDGLMKHYKSDD